MLSTLMDTVDVGVVACDADGHLTVFNRASREFHGMPADATLDPADWADRYDLFCEDGLTRLPMDQIPLLLALQDGAIHDATIVIRPEHGQPRIVRCDGRRLVGADGTVLGAVVAMKDVTEARRGSRALEDREQRFRAAFHDSPTPIAYLGLTGVVLDSNAALRRFLAVGSSRLTDQPLELFAHPDDRDVLQQAFQGEGTGQNPLEVRIRRADGVHLWCEAATTRSSDQAGQPYLLAQFLDIDARKRHELALEAAALRDPLTGLGNRSALTTRLEVLLGPSGPGQGATLLFLDLDGFKAVNDAYGHDAGDAVLAEVAVRLQSAVRPEDLVVRLGGDEFVIACRGGQDRLEPLVERLEQTVSAPVPHGEWLLSVGVSVGTAVGAPGTDPQELLDGADRAMYRRKKQRNHHSAGSGPTAPRRASADAQLAVSVATGVADGRFRLMYQPVIDLRTGRTVGAEALLRLTDTDGSAVTPDTFIPVAEAHGHIGALGRWVLTEALTQAQQWKQSLPAGQDFLIAVNLSPLQLHDPGLVEHVRTVLAATGIDPAAVGLEITESRLLPDTPGVHQTLNELKALGVRIGVDDFGTGYANIGYLATFPFVALKIDRRFTSRLVEDSAEGRLADGVFALARATGLMTIAEGIETVEEREAVLDRGCSLGQGFLWARPLAVDGLGDRLRRELTDLAMHIPGPR